MNRTITYPEIESHLGEKLTALGDIQANNRIINMQIDSIKFLSQKYRENLPGGNNGILGQIAQEKEILEILQNNNNNLEKAYSIGQHDLDNLPPSLSWPL